MAENKNSLLDDIDKHSGETKKIVSGFLGDEANQYSANPKRRMGASVSVNDPIKEKIDQTYIRIESDYCTLKEENKDNLKKQIALLRKKNPRQLLALLATENEKLDKMEALYRDRKNKNNEIFRKQKFLNQSVSLFDKILFFLRRFRYSASYDGKSPSLDTLNSIEVDFKAEYENIRSYVDHFLAECYNKDFVDDRNSSKITTNTYNVLSLLGSESMSIALSKITRTNSKLDSIQEKIDEFDPLVKLIYPLLQFKESTFEKEGEKLIKILERRQHLSHISTAGLKMTNSAMSEIILFIRKNFDKHSTLLQKIQIVYSCAFGYITDLSTIFDYSGSVAVRNERLNLSTLAKKNLIYIKTELEKKRNTIQGKLESVSIFKGQLELAETFNNYILQETQESTLKYLYSDPLAYMNKVSGEFSNLYEDVIAKQIPVSFSFPPGANLPFLPEETESAADEFKLLMLRPEFMGKISSKNHEITDAEFRSKVFDKTTAEYAEYKSIIDYAKKSHFHPTFSLMQRVQRALQWHKQNSKPLLDAPLANEPLRTKLVTIYSRSKSVPFGERLVSESLTENGANGEKKIYPADSFYAYLKLGASILCWLTDAYQESVTKSLGQNADNRTDSIREIEKELALLPEL